MIEDIQVESSDGGTSGSKSKDNNPNELTRASNVAFNSMPYSSGSPLLVPCAEVSKQLLSKSCPDPRDCEQSCRMDGDLCQQVECVSQRKIFSSHWSLDAVNEALEVCLTEVFSLCYVFFMIIVVINR